jgi:Flp pilus assembly protein TadD
MEETKKKAIVYQAILVLTFAIIGFLTYSNTLNAPFVFDDESNITNNPNIRLTSFSLSGIFSACFESRSSRRPVSNFTFALNYYFGRYNPTGYHYVNIIIHIITGVFLYHFVKETLRTPALKGKYSRHRTIAFFAAIVWFVHPVQTQAITYIVQRMTSMASMFFVLSLLLYVNGRLARLAGGRSWPYFAGSCLASLLAFSSKEITATLPVFILIYEWYFFQSLDTQWLKRRWPYAAGIAAIFAILALLYMGPHPIDRISATYQRWGFTATERVLTQFRIVVHYISLLVYPHPARLNLDYDFPLSNSLINPASTLICFLAIVALVGAAVYEAKKQPLLSFCILWFFGNLIIESSVIALELVFEHRLYLPSMMVSVAAVAVAGRFIKLGWIRMGIFCTMVILLCSWTYERNIVWVDAATLWKDCVDKSPNKPRPYNNLAIILREEGQIDESIAYLQKALELKPNHTDAHNNLALAMQLKGDLEQAVEHYFLALQTRPDDAKTHNNLGIALTKLGKFDDALGYFQTASELEPDWPLPLSGTARILAIHPDPNTRDPERALTLAKQVAELTNYQDATILDVLATSYAATGRLDEAVSTIRTALTLASEAKNKEMVNYLQKRLQAYKQTEP